MKVAITGASGLIGKALIERLRADGEQITVLTRDPERARGTRERGRREGSTGEHELARWDPLRESAPGHALQGRDVVVHLAGEPIAQRWSEDVKRAIRESRIVGTRNLVAGLRKLPPGERPGTLVSASAVGYYGPHGPEPIDEEAPAGEDFLAGVCAAWESEARAAERLEMRTVQVRTGVVLAPSGGALAQMLPAFRLGFGGPVAGGEQFLPWIHREDLVAIMLTAAADERWSGAVNGTAPEPVTSREFAQALGRTLHRPARLPVPAFALRLLYGEMASVITEGVRAVPARALMLGYSFEHPRLSEALRSVLA